MRKDVLDCLRGIKPQKIPSKETLNHPGIIKHVTGIDPFHDTPRAFLEAYKKLGIDVINNLPDKNVSPPRDKAETSETDSDGFRSAYLGIYDTSGQVEFHFSSVEEVLSYDVLKHHGPGSKEYQDKGKILNDISDKNKLLGPWGIYYYLYYTTLFMWGVMIFGWERYMEAVALEPEKFDRQILSKFFEVSKAQFMDFAETDQEFVFCHDDLSMTHGPVFHPEWYDRYIFSRYKELFKPVKEKNKVLIFSSDGNIDCFLDRLLEVGIDGIMFENPATNFDRVIEKFRKKIFIGGIDTKILTFGTPQDIKIHVTEVIEKTRNCPGFIIASCGGLHGNIPLENLSAYFDTRHKLGC